MWPWLWLRCCADERGCVVVDFLPSLLRSSCIGCSGVMTMDSFQPGRPWDKACIHCRAR
jgi:hypothetical protein